MDLQNISFQYEIRNFTDKNIYIEINNPVLSEYKNHNNLNRNINKEIYLDYLPEQVEFLINSLNKLFPYNKKIYHKVGVS